MPPRGMKEQWGRVRTKERVEVKGENTSIFFHVTPINTCKRLLKIQKTPHLLLRKLLIAHGKKKLDSI